MKPAQTNHALEVTTPNDREIVMTRAFDAPANLVFDAFTQPALLKRWLLGPDGWSMPTCEVDLRAGGAFRYGWRNDADGREFALQGVYREIAPATRIVHSEHFEGDLNMGDALVTTAFVERSGSTTVTMTVQYPSREVRDAALESGMTSGVTASYDRLEGILGAAAA